MRPGRFESKATSVRPRGEGSPGLVKRPLCRPLAQGPCPGPTVRGDLLTAYSFARLCESARRESGVPDTVAAYLAQDYRSDQ